MQKMIQALRRSWFAAAFLLGLPAAASADVTLKQGDILVAEPLGVISVIDPVTGTTSVVAEGGLLSSVYKTVGVAFAADGDIIVVRRDIGLIRVNPVTGSQSILSQGGFFRDPWAIAIDNATGYIYVADSGYDNDRPEINEAGKIIRVDPASGAQVLVASGSACNVFPANEACQNTTSAGSYLAHPYGIAIDYSTSPSTLVVADMSSFNGKGAIIRIQAAPNGAQTLLWGPASASPAPRIVQSSPLACPMGVAVEPNGNILTTVFTFPVPPNPTVPPPAGTFYGCAAPGIFRLDLANNVQSVLSTNAPAWQENFAYSIGDVVRADDHVHRVVTAGVSQGSAPNWSVTLSGTTADGTVTWQNIGRGASWSIPFGLSVEPAPTPANPSGYNIIVPDEGFSAVFRLSPDGNFVSPTPLATNLFVTPAVHVITIPVPGQPDLPPVRSNGSPSGVLTPGTLQATLGLTTNEAATCRYGTQPGVPYDSMTNTFSTTGGTTHSSIETGLSSGGYLYYVRCVDTLGNANTTDFVIGFSIASATATFSNFAGIESPLSEGGLWDSPGSWVDLQKDAGAYATGVNAQARLSSPLVSPDQYAQITYDQDPGLDGSWVGVATRIQGPGDGSGYLAIVYAGDVRLYRTDDTGSLSFTLLASATVATGAAPRKLRLESEGNTHRVYFNDVLVITHLATSTLYTSGQPGIAASVFGGPQVKILSFEGGSLVTTPPDTTPPETIITSGPDEVTNATSATFEFASNEAGSTFQCRLDGAAFAACTSPRTVTGLAVGSHTFDVRAIDAANNTDLSPATVVWTVEQADETPPETIITNGPDELTSASSASFSFAANEAGSTFECRLDGAPFETCTSPRTVSGLAAGSHTFEVRAIDAAGNLDASPATLVWTIDQTAPDTTLTSGPATVTTSTTATFAFTSSEAGSSFQCRLDDAAFAACTSPISYTGLADGAHSFQVRAIDAAGNVDATPAGFNWTVDTVAPDTTIGSGPASLSNSQRASFTFSSTQAGSTFQCSLDGAPFATCSSPRTYFGLLNGSHTFRVRARDAAGNIDPTPAGYTWTIDLVAPVATITSAPPALTNLTIATFAFTSNDPAATFQCRLDKAAFAPCVSPISYTGLANGSRNFRVRAVDPAGNFSEVVLYSWTVDTTPPDTRIKSGPGTTTTSTSATFTFTASQAGSTFTCSLDGAAFTPCTSSVTYSQLAVGRHTFLVRATDPAGNTDPTPATFTWTIR